MIEELMIELIIALPLCIGIIYLPNRHLRKNTGEPILNIILDSLFLLLYGVTFLFFASGTEGTEYHKAIDPINDGYTAFSLEHIFTLRLYLCLFFVSAITVWLKGRTLPPLILVLCLTFLLIGIGINIAVIGQVSDDPTGGFPGMWRDSGFFGFIFNMSYPLLNIVMAIVLIIKVIKQEVEISTERRYKNKFLNWLNNLVANKPVVWAFILFLPVFVIVTLILILFGQAPDSIVKVFTETTTWKFSQQTHPPYLAHHGHYLCTVAACGNPKLVKPVRLGKRNGNEIIVNRQLMIANAYEEMISDYAPKFHHFIRNMYDKYGYPLSKHINTPFRSGIIYLLMKPLEYFFLINLYLLCVNPEKKINKQYL